MSQDELDNLVRIKQLKPEKASRNEFSGMVHSAKTRLADSQNEDLDPDSRFDLAYGAAHRLALAVLRHRGYRSENRITVFQTLVHTLATDKGRSSQVFLKAHNERNLAEYEGRMEIDEQLLADLIRCARRDWRRRLESSIPLPANEIPGYIAASKLPVEWTCYGRPHQTQAQTRAPRASRHAATRPYPDLHDHVARAATRPAC